MVDCHRGTGNSTQTIRRFTLCQSTGPTTLTAPDGAVPGKVANSISGAGTDAPVTCNLSLNGSGLGSRIPSPSQP